MPKTASPKNTSPKDDSLPKSISKVGFVGRLNGKLSKCPKKLFSQKLTEWQVEGVPEYSTDKKSPYSKVSAKDLRKQFIKHCVDHSVWVTGIDGGVIESDASWKGEITA